LSKAWGLYRQNYCACIYSEAERFGKELKAAMATDEVNAGSRQTESLPPP